MSRRGTSDPKCITPKKHLRLPLRSTGFVTRPMWIHRKSIPKVLPCVDGHHNIDRKPRFSLGVITMVSVRIHQMRGWPISIHFLDCRLAYDGKQMAQFKSTKIVSVWSSFGIFCCLLLCHEMWDQCVHHRFSSKPESMTAMSP